MKNLKKLTNLKKLSRTDLKKYNGGKVVSYEDMCTKNSDCPPGLACGVYEGHDQNGYWVAYRCI